MGQLATYNVWKVILLWKRRLDCILVNKPEYGTHLEADILDFQHVLVSDINHYFSILSPLVHFKAQFYQFKTNPLDFLLEDNDNV